MANTGGGMSDAQPRLAEPVGALSLATDLAAGLAFETAHRTCLLAVRLGRTLGVQILQDMGIEAKATVFEIYNIIEK